MDALRRRKNRDLQKTKSDFDNSCFSCSFTLFEVLKRKIWWILKPVDQIDKIHFVSEELNFRDKYHVVLICLCELRFHLRYYDNNCVNKDKFFHDGKSIFPPMLTSIFVTLSGSILFRINIISFQIFRAKSPSIASVTNDEEWYKRITD